MVRRSVALILVAGLALAGAPLTAAQEYAPKTIWGEVPASASSAASAVLLDATGYTMFTITVVNGRFAFENIPPGTYSVVLRDAGGSVLTRSHVADMPENGVVKVLFDPQLTAAAPPPGGGGGGGGGLTTTGWILIGAGAAGIATAIVLLEDDGDGVASPSR